MVKHKNQAIKSTDDVINDVMTWGHHSGNSKRLNIEQIEERNDLPLNKKMKREMKEESHVAIIVPFRDLHAEQKRQAHLDQFIPHMTDLLSQCHQIK